MHLSLKPISSNTATIAAAFLPGTDPALWLREIARWKLDWHAPDYYLVPRSLDDNQLSGLFVVFPFDKRPAVADFPNPYIRYGKRLFIPQDAALFPPLFDTEKEHLSSWEIQMFHPSAGLVGFGKEDAINLVDLLHTSQSASENWSMARAGIPPAPLLREVSVEQVDIDDVFGAIQDQIKPKSLDEIPGIKGGKGDDFDLLSRLGLSLLKGASGLTASFIENFGSEMSPAEYARTGPGALNKLETWLRNKMKELEGKRNKELKRLEELFEEDPDEALRYALPLNSNYEGRGVSQPGSSLSRGNFDFSLGKLGGGGAIDAWNMDHQQYAALRNKYLAAANSAIEKGDFRKAAYIHAHLLGDLWKAANVLEQGGFYNEAAALYKDHLKDKTAAARCLDEAGAWSEAAALFEEVEDFEKAGDLYHRIQRDEKAARLYHKAVAKAQNNQKLLQAGNILNNKLHDKQAAEDQWLAGWSIYAQAEDCLDAFLNSVAQGDEKRLIKTLGKVYEQTPSGPMEDKFVRMLLQQKDNQNSETFDAFSQQLAYEVTSRKLQNNDGPQSFHAWRKLLPKDQLLGKDVNRFISSKKAALPPLKEIEEIVNLGVGDTQWLSSFVCLNQLFVLGLDIKKGKLVLAKVNGKNRPSLYFYDLPIQEPDYVNLLRPEESILHRLLDGGIDAYPDPYGSGKVLLFSPAAVVKINWNPEVGKQKIHLLSPSLFTDFEAGFCFGFIKDQMIFHALHDGSTTFYHHNFDLTKSVDWLLPFEHLLDEYAFNTMFVRNGRIYQTTSQSFQVKKEEENEFKIIAPLAGGYDPGIMWPSPYNLHSDWAIWGKEGFQIVRFNEKGHSLSEPFSPPSKENFKPLKMAIVPADKLVIASISRIKVYDIIPETPVLMHEYQAEDTILDIQSSGERNTVLVILKKGKVLKYRLD